ncbi:MAG TPA: agmatinase [bacterium]|nr:agmatinase [bacterium]
MAAEVPRKTREVPAMRPSDLPSATQSPRFSGIRTFMRLPWAADLREAGVQVAIMGIPFDTAASFRTGARFGPSAIRDISVLLRPSNQFHRINALDALRVVDRGDVAVVPGDIARTYANIEEEWARCAAAGVVPIGLGGDHSVTLGELRALARRDGPLALVQFDSHTDTWDNYWGVRYTHGTGFRRACEEGLIETARSIQVGLRGSEYAPGDLDENRRLGFEVLLAPDLLTMSPIEVAAAIRRRVGAGPAFLSFDIDFFDPAFAPGTGTPEAGGPTSAFGLQVVRHLAGIPFVGYDVVEVLPAHDSAAITALLAATVVFEFLALIALSRSGARTEAAVQAPIATAGGDGHE